MKRNVTYWFLFLGLVAVFVSGSIVNIAAAEVRYNRDVLPILSSKCFSCHGADSAARKAGLRLDQEDSAISIRDGRRAISPRHPNQSELVRRIFSTNNDVLMPPVGSGSVLTNTERKILKQWIREGAVYETHWAFQRPRKINSPRFDWGNNPIDGFVFKELRAAKLNPQQAASKGQWLRRVTFDLTGLPPTVSELETFLADKSPQAFGRVVDRLLKSPRYGERMAMWWLDGARYGDSHGYDNDLENSQWPWRNWVIDAFNNNKPIDQFTIEQLAGDLLPNPTEDQILATGFNRNHRIQTEGGAIDEEWRTEYVIDRVETVGTVWMGLTLGCCRCHDHKYDPISQREFYQVFALFNNLDEKGFINNLRGAAEPRIRYKPDEYEEEKKGLEDFLKDKKQLEDSIKALDERFPLVMIMRDMPTPRQTYLLKRGQYDAPGDEVFPDLPVALSSIDMTKALDRLTFARWLVDGKNPLTARVTVNRIWEQLFGMGIVESSENLGLQADWPSHPELLDWLAVDFVEHGWDVKRFMKQIVTSATYRQDNAVDATRLEKDPKNRLFSRGPRGRLQAEMMRDQALFLSGLLIEQIGGPSVRPYQPAGLWEEVEKRGTFKQDHGKSLYRRTFYTAIRRTVVTPELILFDMPSREVCTVRRSRTNTPLQALSLLNSVTFVEAAKKFAERMLKNGKNSTEQISWGFRAATQRTPKDIELRILASGFERRLAVYQEKIIEAEQLLKQGESEVSKDVDKAKLAAMTTVASLILNLDEVINK